MDTSRNQQSRNDRGRSFATPSPTTSQKKSKAYSEKSASLRQKSSHITSKTLGESQQTTPHNIVTDKYEIEAEHSMVDWFKKALHNSFKLRGRARRKEYWSFVLGYLLLLTIAMTIDINFHHITYFLPTALVGIGLLIPVFTVTVRRLHDIGRSSFWLLLPLLPFIGWVAIFLALITDTVFVTNKWGEPARRQQEA